MAQVTVHEAKTHLSRLIRRAQAGEEVIIARGDTPVVRLVAIDSQPRERRLGAPDWWNTWPDFNAKTWAGRYPDWWSTWPSETSTPS